MAILHVLLLFCASYATHAATTPLDASIQVRNAPGHTVEDTYRAVRRGLAVASLEKREDYKAEMSIARSWSGATLLSVELPQNPSLDHQNGTTEIEAGLEVICQTCYVKGSATAELKISGGFNASQLIEQSIDAVNSTVRNFTDTFENYIENYVDQVKDNLKDGIDASDFDFPTIDLAFDIDVPPVPDANLHFQFDDMELYLELETTISAGATYEVTLFATQTPVGVKMGKYLQLGAVLTVDLLLSVEGEVDISSGFHIKLDDGVGIDIALFGDTVSDLTINGGSFEFLPVTLESANVALSAALRVGAHLGVEVVQPESPFATVMSEYTPHIQSGIEVAIYANVAEFKTNVTYAPEDKECDLKVVQEYNLAVGAIAGASVVVDWRDQTATWGPVNEKSIAVFTTTLAEVCGSAKATSAATVSASSGSVSPTITPAPERRQDLVTTTISTVLTRSGISCKVMGLTNCPNSQQVTTKAVISSTITTAVPSGVEVTWPADTKDTVTTSVPFGKHVRTIKALSGSPVPYVAPPEETKHHEGDGDGGVASSLEHVIKGETGGVSNGVIIGVSVGLGIPFLVGLAGAMVFFWRRKKRYGAVGGVSAEMVSEEYRGREEYKDGVIDVREESNGGESRR
ncbi:hypothetical protein PTNB85_08649 [Pyrenophora teres f. teres]|nr:hypothetical protein PTNB85_08649 [Pyrenophora teres f. teres]